MKLEAHYKLAMHGQVDLTLRDASGQVKQSMTARNKLLNNGYLDRLFGNTAINLLGWGNPLMLISDQPFCHIGTGTTPAEHTDVELDSEVLRVQFAAGQQTRSDFGVNPVFKSQLFQIAGSSYTGSVTEVGLSTIIGGFRGLVARLVLPSAVSVGANDILDIRWTVFVNFGTQVLEGQLEDAQRDGETAIDWRLTINNQQMMTHCQREQSAAVGGFNQSIGHNAWTRLFSASNHPYVILGDSNAASDLANDGQYTIKGNELFAGVISGNLKTVSGYQSGDYERAVTIGFGQAVAEGEEIGEMVVGSHNAATTANSHGGLFRITFNPKLDKAAGWRLFVRLVYGIVIPPDEVS